MLEGAKRFVIKKVKNPHVRAVLSQLRVSLKFPSILYFEAAAVCNYSCEMCPQNFRRVSGSKLMSFDLFKKGIDESLQYGRRTGIFFHSRGEPLLNPRAIDMIEYACGRNVADASHLSTNGFFLSEDICRRLIRSGLQSVSISIDAVDKASYKRIKGVDAYEKVTGNVENLIRLKNELRSPTPLIRPKFIPMKDNSEQMSLFRERWRHADDVIISDFIFWPGYQEAGAQHTGKSVRLASNICTFPWSSIVINYDGAVALCCNDFDEKLVYGNLNSQSIYQLWHTPRLQAVRKAFFKGDKAIYPTCAACRYFDRPASLANTAEQCFVKCMLGLKGS